MRRLARPALFASFLAASLSAPAAEPLRDLESALAAIEASSGGRLGVSAIHLESGRSASRNASERFPMASVYKLPVAAALLARVDAGTLRLEQEVVVNAGELRRTGSRVDPWKPGAPVTLYRLLHAMMTESDNTACDVLLRVLGGGRAVDGWLDAQGFPGIDVTFTELTMGAVSAGVAELPKDGACDHACLDALVAKVPRERRAEAERAFEADARNAATPGELGRFLVALKAGKLLSPPSTANLLAMMRRNRTGDRRIRALLPEGTAVWDKTGSIGRSANDVGFVRLPGEKGTLALVVLVKGSAKGWPERDRAIAEAAKAAFEAFSR